MPDKETGPSCIDIREDNLLALSAEVLDTLLCDHTTGRNIFWATHDYEALGSEYDYHSEILPHLITGEHGMIIRPRVLKSKSNQADRSRDMAEVFTPSWICNAQNNLVDEAWFGRKDVFNVEDATNHTWKANPNKIEFPEGKTWKDYVRATRMEITCGEAPYLVSRYDATTGEPIPIEQRIGLLDRKLRVISENVNVSGDWLDWAQEAYKHTYGYEWQGDKTVLYGCVSRLYGWRAQGEMHEWLDSKNLKSLYTDSETAYEDMMLFDGERNAQNELEITSCGRDGQGNQYFVVGEDTYYLTKNMLAWEKEIYTGVEAPGRGSRLYYSTKLYRFFLYLYFDNLRSQK